MRAVPLHHHRATGGKRGGSVAACGRERQGEIRGAEHRHGTERDHAQAQVGLGGRAFAVGMVDAQFLPLAVADFLGEQAELARSAPALAGDTRDRQTGFARRAPLQNPKNMIIL